MRKLKILKDLYREKTIYEICKTVLSSLFAYEYVYIVMRSLDSQTFPDIDCIYKNRIVKGSISELDRIRQITTDPPWELNVNNYDGVEDFFMFVDDENIKHITWIYYSNDPNKDINLNYNEAELKYGITDPEYRGQKLLPASLVEIQKYLAKKNIKRVFATILDSNFSSLRSVERAGFTLVDKKLSIRIFGFVVTPRYRYKGTKAKL